MLRFIFMAAISLALSACVSGKFTGDASQIYSDTSDAASVVVMREPALQASRVPMIVELDGKVLATLGTGDYIQVPVSPGKHYVVVIMYDKLLQKINAKPGVEYYFRFSTDMFGAYTFEQLTPDDGRRDIIDSKYDLIGFK